MASYNLIPAQFTKDTFKAWVAGFYEGEGCICNDRTNSNRLRLSIAQNDRHPLDVLCAVYGGSVLKRTRQSPASKKICEGHEWRIGHHGALMLIQDMKPYLLIPYKINQIEAALSKITIKVLDRYTCTQCTLDFASPSGRRRYFKLVHEHPDASVSSQS